MTQDATRQRAARSPWVDKTAARVRLAFRCSCTARCATTTTGTRGSTPSAPAAARWRPTTRPPLRYPPPTRAGRHCRYVTGCCPYACSRFGLDDVVLVGCKHELPRAVLQTASERRRHARLRSLVLSGGAYLVPPDAGRQIDRRASAVDQGQCARLMPTSEEPTERQVGHRADVLRRALPRQCDGGMIRRARQHTATTALLHLDARLRPLGRGAH